MPLLFLYEYSNNDVHVMLLTTNTKLLYILYSLCRAPIEFSLFLFYVPSWWSHMVCGSKSTCTLPSLSGVQAPRQCCSTTPSLSAFPGTAPPSWPTLYYKAAVVFDLAGPFSATLEGAFYKIIDSDVIHFLLCINLLV